MLPILHMNGRDPARAGAVSDASLLDVITVLPDPDIWLNGTTPNSVKALRAGTVAVLTGPDRAATPAAPTDHQAEGRFRRYVGIAASHYEANKFGIYESEEASLDGVTYAPRPANAVSTGRMWLFAKVTGVTPSAGVQVKTYDAANDPVQGMVELAAAADDKIPGWFFTGRTAKHDGKYDIAEVQIRPQTV
jgi:hypothetical protein